MSRYRSLALFVALAVLWGGSFPAIEVGLAYIPPVLFAALRYGVAGVLLLGYAAVAAPRWRPRGRTDLAVLLACGVFFIGGNGLLFIGQQYTTSGVAAIIYSLNPILTVAFAWVLLSGERYTVPGLVGVGLGFAGVAAIARPDPGNLLAENVVGMVLITVSAGAVALGSVIIRRSDSTLPQSSFTAWSMLVGAVLLQLASLGAGESVADVVVTTESLVAFLYLTVFSTVVAFVIYFVLLSLHGPLEANLVSYAVPVVATVIGWALLAEPVTRWTVLGFLLIFCGFVLIKRSALRAELQRLRTEHPAD